MIITQNSIVLNLQSQKCLLIYKTKNIKFPLSSNRHYDKTTSTLRQDNFTAKVWLQELTLSIRTENEQLQMNLMEHQAAPSSL